MHGDARLELEFVKTESIDCVFTSPEPPINYNELIEIENIMLALDRTVKETGSIWVNMSDYHNADGILAAIPERFIYDMVVGYEWQLMNTIIWNRPAPHDANSPTKRFRRSHEYLYWFVKDVDKYYTDDLVDEQSDVITICYQKPRQDVFESGFPELLIETTAILTTPHNGRILDPFCGTGTTGVVALEYGHEFLGIEANAALIQRLEDRLRNTCQQQLNE